MTALPPYLFSIVITAGVLIGVGLVALESVSVHTDQSSMPARCCANQTCTDTYYSPDDGLCHLVLCENAGFPNCTYLAKNVTPHSLSSLGGVS